MEFLVHGYAVEYDVVDVTQLDETLQSQDIEACTLQDKLMEPQVTRKLLGKG